jgi:RimJ/RimL family protein N-acetyltransferase
MIEGKLVTLRTVKEKDLPDLYIYLDSMRLRGDYLPGPLLSEAKFKTQFLETGFWAEQEGLVIVQIKERVVGALWYIAHPSLEALDLYFYMFRPEDRGKKWMSEAFPLFCNYLFYTKKVYRLQSLIPDYSKAAIRIVQKGQFQFEGIIRKAFFHRGQYLDLCLYGLIRDDWERQNHTHLEK